MTWGWLLSLALKLLGLFRGGKGSRVNLEIRSENSLEAERKRRTLLADRVQEIQNAIDTLSIKIAWEKSAGRDTVALDVQRQRLLAQRHDAKRKYDDELRHTTPGR